MEFTTDQMNEIKKRYRTLTSKALYEHLKANFGLDHKYTSYRTRLYKEGFYKCGMMRWTLAETQYLLDNYKIKGNIEIAKKLSKKGRKVTKKQVEKKMKLMKLQRTADERKKIIDGHKKKGTYHKANLDRWEKKKAKEGDLHVQLAHGVPRVMIKIDGLFTPYARYRYRELHGEIPQGMKVYFKDMNPLNINDDNLILKKGSGLNKVERELFRKSINEYMKSQNKDTVNVPARAPVLPIPPSPSTTNKIAVKVNDKTTIWVRPGTDIDAIKKRYNQLRLY